jgi:L-2-hydroxyglutarate oxidase LhgO
VNGLIYPIPDPDYPFLGVHFTRRVGGHVDIGPNAVLALAREGYRRRDISVRELAETLAWPGFRSLARRHWKMGIGEYAGSASRRLYLERARRYVPALRYGDVVAAPAGVRAQAVDRDGTLVDDFRINHLGAVTAVRNAPSPAATSSLAIAEYVGEQVLGHTRSTS